MSGRRVQASATRARFRRAAVSHRALHSRRARPRPSLPTSAASRPGSALVAISWPARRTPGPGAPAPRRLGCASRATISVAAGDDVGRAGMHVDDAEVGHAAAAARARPTSSARPQRVIGGGQEGVAAPLHRRGAGVVGLAVEDDARASDAHDGIDHARWARRLPPAAGPARCAARCTRAPRPGARSPRGTAARRSRRAPSRRRACRRPPRPWLGIGGRVEPAAERPRAEEAAVASFLVAPRRDHQRRRGAAPASRMACRHSRPAITPSAPSSVPPSGTVSMCEPVTTAGAEALKLPAPRPPKTLPAGSIHVVRPAAFISRERARPALPRAACPSSSG